jgi:hypothetical protein
VRREWNGARMGVGPKPALMAHARAATLRIVTAEEGSPYPKCSLFLRGGARAIDLLAAIGVYYGTGRAGAVMALLYVLLADGIFLGQSIGKRIFGVKAVYLPTRAPARSRDSVLRNAPFGLIILLGMMPEGLGRVAFFAGALVIGGIEAWKVYRHPLGIRLGDVWAETQVVDGKVVAGAQAAPISSAGERAAGRIMYAARDRAS